MSPLPIFIGLFFSAVAGGSSDVMILSSRHRLQGLISRLPLQHKNVPGSAKSNEISYDRDFVSNTSSKSRDVFS